jgi:hypothetical protein
MFFNAQLQGEKVNQVQGHTAKVLSLYHWASKKLVLSGGFDSTSFGSLFSPLFLCLYPHILVFLHLHTDALRQATVIAWNSDDFSCATDIKGRHKDGIRAMICPDDGNTLWTGSDDKEAGVQVYTAVEQGLELASFVGTFAPLLFLSKNSQIFHHSLTPT